MSAAHESVTQADPGLVSSISFLLDRAHAELPTPELAGLLLALEGPANHLARSGAPVDGEPLPLSERARTSLLPIRAVLQRAADDVTPAAGAERRSGLGRWLVQYLDEVAARPRGAALAG